MIGILRMILYMVFVDFVVIGVIVATVCWLVLMLLVLRHQNFQFEDTHIPV